jgi:HK97 family phage major capsid protein
MSRKIKELQEKRTSLEDKVKAVKAKCESESRDLTPDELKESDKVFDEMELIDKQIRFEEKQEEIDKRSAKPVGKPDPSLPTPQSQSEIMSVRSQVEKWWNENKENIEASRRNAIPLPPLQIRAVATMTHSKVNAGASAYLPNPVVLPGVVDLNRTKPTFWNRLNKPKVNANPLVIAYKTNKEGNAQFIAEGALKPLASFEMATMTSVPKKAAESMKVSREVLYDIDQITSLIEDELRFEVEVAANTAVLTGTLSSESPAGVTTIASAYTLTTVETTTPNNLDAIRAAIAQLRTLNFDRDIVAYINPVDAANMDLSKGDDGHYLLPPFTTIDGQIVKGITVIEDNNIAAGYLLIGDMSKYNIKIHQDFFVEWGLENDDFRRNLVTVIGEIRFHQYMTPNNSGAFIYDAFADIKTAIAAA